MLFRSPRSRRARADAPASLSSRSRVWGEPVLPIWTATPPFPANNTAPTQPPTRTHIPQGMLRGRAAGPPRPRKRAMEQFTAAASSWSSFLSGDKRRGYNPVAAQDAPPAGSSLFLSALRGPRPGPMAPLPPPGAKAERPGDKRRDQGRGADPRRAPAASRSFAPGRSWVCVKAASSPDAMAEYARVRSGGSGTFLAPLPASLYISPARRNRGHRSSFP